MTPRRIIVTGAAGLFAAAGVMAAVAPPASAAPPAGYKCGPGGKKNASKQRCDCPAGKRPARNAADEAICKKKPAPPVVEKAPDATGPRSRPPVATSSSTPARVSSCPRDMVLVPGGTFLMGSPEGVGASDERPQRQVTLSPYCIDRTEVTVAAYEACATCASAATAVHWPGMDEVWYQRWKDLGACNGNLADRQEHPANCIEWREADAYCRAAGKRLPTEAEWEYAARGTDGRTYPWGNKEPSARHLNACGSECRAFASTHKMDWSAMYEADDGHPRTAPVGRFPEGASPFGALDMAGNVWEWTADEYADYPAGAATDPRPATTSRAPVDKTYVLRGGGWNTDDRSYVRAAYRFGYVPPVLVFIGVGFRCARGG